MRVPDKSLRLISKGFAVMALVACSRGPAVDGECHTLAATASVSDIALDQERGVAYLTYVDRKPDDEDKKPTGTIMLVDLNAKEPRIRAALVTEPPEFRPDSLSLEIGQQGERRLLVTDVDGSTRTFEQSSTGAFALAQAAPGTSQGKHGAVNVVKQGKRSLVGSTREPYLQLCEAK